MYQKKKKDEVFSVFSAFHQQESGQEQEVVTRDEEVKKREELIPGFIHPSKQRNRRIYDQLKK